MKMKKLHLLALVILIMFGLSGCEKKVVTDTATADVFIKALTNDQGVTVYAAVHSVFSYNVMKSVSVVAPDGTQSQLLNYQNAGYSFYNEPASADYLPTIPTIGVYTYTVTFNDGTVSTYTNSLSNASILPSTVTLSKSAAGDSVYISWTAITNVDTYRLEVKNGTAQAFYADGLADNNIPKRAFLKVGFVKSALTSGISGTYTFTLSGFLYESSDFSYLQATTSTTKQIAL
jgi:hypothetical protein